jgi:nitrogen fixation NifU-like protein
MSDLRDLYQEVILDHNKRPRNFGVLERADRSAIGHNPLCGDKLTVYLRLDGDRVAYVRFEGLGCAISKASASMMTEVVKGLSDDDITTLFERFHHLVTAPGLADEDERLGKLAVFAGVREYPTRVKCATLCWHTLRAALDDKTQEPVTTE